MAVSSVEVPLYQDPFNPILKSPTTFNASDEQKLYIKEVLETACSDSRFAQKAYIAIVGILGGSAAQAPVVSSINPTSVVVGSANFILHVTGTGFATGSVVVLGGVDSVTTLVSATELTTEVDMTTAVAGPITVAVKSAEGTLSNAQTLTVTPLAGTTFAATTKTTKKEKVEEKE